MVSTEVQRTLVKSPPELWAELSDPAALARHLGELGEIRITRLEPGEKVEWEAADTSGTVVLKPSGWGTKVTLTATSDDAEAGATNDAEAPAADAAERPSIPTAPATPEPAPRALPEPAPDGQTDDVRGPAEAREPVTGAPPGTAIQAWRELTAYASAETGFPLARRPATAAEDAPATADEPAPVESEPRRGFFARLFRRRRAPLATSPPADSVTAEPRPPTSTPAEDPTAEPLTSAPVEDTTDTGLSSSPGALPTTGAGVATAASVLAGPGQASETIPGPSDPPAADAGPCFPPEPRSAGEAIPDGVPADRVTAVLTATLDRLGAAHHRPFSRA